MIAAMTMQLATTVQEVTPAHATLDTQAMDFLAQVTVSTLYLQHILNDPCLYKHVPAIIGHSYEMQKAHYNYHRVWEINHYLLKM